MKKKGGGREMGGEISFPFLVKGRGGGGEERGRGEVRAVSFRRENDRASEQEREREATAKGAMPLITHSVTLRASERPSTQWCHCSDGCFRKRWRHVLSPTSQRGHAPAHDVSRDLIRLRVRHTGYHRTQTLTHRDTIRPRHSLSRIQHQTHRHWGSYQTQTLTASDTTSDPQTLRDTIRPINTQGYHQTQTFIVKDTTSDS